MITVFNCWLRNPLHTCLGFKSKSVIKRYKKHSFVDVPFTLDLYKLLLYITSIIHKLQLI